MFKGKDLNIGHQDKCQSCESDRLELVMDLGHHAPCDSLLALDELQTLEVTYPLTLVYCLACFLVQINYVVPPEELFPKSYPYRSGITKSLVRKLQSTAESVNGIFPFQKNDLVVDIGSNDGTLLSGFKKLGARVLGIEPSDIALIAQENGIETLQAFFSELIAEKISSEYGQARVVTATNVFAHMPTIQTFMLGIKKIIEPEGVFVSESHYLRDILEGNQFDSIYHEHLRFYSLHSAKSMLESYGFKVVDVEFLDNYGGSIRIYAKLASSAAEISPIVQNTLDNEKGSGILNAKNILSFADRSFNLKLELRKLLVSLQDQGKKVVGVGCPGRASTLLNYSGIDTSLMPYIAEQSTSLKIGLFLPGIHTPIVDEKLMFDEQPDYALLLSWHYSGDIIKNLRQKGLRSRIILPLPNIAID